MDTLLSAYRSNFGVSASLKRIYSPYRICPIGAHVDHQGGQVTGFAIDKGIDFVFSPTDDGRVDFLSLSFDGICTFYVGHDIENRQNFWGDYLRGACWALRKEHHLKRGVRGVLAGSMPVCGLSSSAALICGFVMALAEVNGIRLSPMDIVGYASLVERQYIGLNNGILDQACVVLCKKDMLLSLDTDDCSYTLIPFGGKDNTPVPCKIGVFYSGVSRQLISTDYNLRVSECQAAAWMIQSYEELPLIPLANTRLRDLPEQAFRRHEGQMPPRFSRRTNHFYGENARVTEGIAAWRAGDIHRFGGLMFDSCASSIGNYECGSPELIALYEIMLDCPGIYGGRFSGAGFKGACIALIESEQEEAIREHVTKAYLQRFPQYKDTFTCCFCETTDGVRFID